MKKLLIAIMLALTASQSFAAASIVPAFSKYSAVGGSVDAGKQGTNTMQVIGATFSKPSGKPTMTIVPIGVVDASNYPTLALADDAAVAAGKLLVVSSHWTVIPPVLSSNIKMMPGGKLNGSTSVTINGNFEGAPGCFGTGMTVTFGAGSIKAVYPEFWTAGAVSDVEIQKAVESVSATTTAVAPVVLSALYTTTGSVTLYRGVTLKGQSIGCGLYANGNFQALKFATKNGAFPQYVTVETMIIQGSNNPAHTLNNAVEFAGGMKYCTFKDLRLYQMGGTTIQTLGGADSGAIYCKWSNVSIINPNGVAVHLTGNIGQCYFDLHIYGLANCTTGILLEDAGNGSSVLSNTFTNGIESGGASGAPPAGYKAVYFKGLSTYAAVDTRFDQFYIEPWGPTATPGALTHDLVITGYYIESAKGVTISGGAISFCHFGVWAVGQYAEGIKVGGVTFSKSNTWNADTSGCGMFRADNTANKLFVDPGCTALVVGTYAWPIVYASSIARVYGNKTFNEQTSITVPYGSSANIPSTASSVSNIGDFYYVQAGSGSVDQLRVKMKMADDSVSFVPIGTMWDYNGTFSTFATTVNANSGNTMATSMTGCRLGRFVRIAPSVSLDGLVWSAQCTSSSTADAVLSFYNPTGSPVTISAGTWNYAVSVK